MYVCLCVYTYPINNRNRLLINRLLLFSPTIILCFLYTVHEQYILCMYVCIFVDIYYVIHVLLIFRNTMTPKTRIMWMHNYLWKNPNWRARSRPTSPIWLRFFHLGPLEWLFSPTLATLLVPVLIFIRTYCYMYIPFIV